MDCFLYPGRSNVGPWSCATFRSGPGRCYDQFGMRVRDYLWTPVQVDLELGVDDDLAAG